MSAISGYPLNCLNILHKHYVDTFKYKLNICCNRKLVLGVYGATFDGYFTKRQLYLLHVINRGKSFGVKIHVAINRTQLNLRKW